jgi:hypothetical protein
MPLTTVAYEVKPVGDLLHFMMPVQRWSVSVV